MGSGVKVQVGLRSRYTQVPIHQPGAIRRSRGDSSFGHATQDSPSRPLDFYHITQTEVLQIYLI